MRKKYTIEDMQKLAEERGGKCLSDEYVNISTKLKWCCFSGHEWEEVPYFILHRNRWCEICKKKIEDMHKIHQEALNGYFLALKNSPFHPECLYNIACIYAIENKTSDARKFLRMALKYGDYNLLERAKNTEELIRGEHNFLWLINVFEREYIKDKSKKQSGEQECNMYKFPETLSGTAINKAGHSLNVTGNLGEEIARQILYIKYNVDSCLRQSEANTLKAPQGIRIPETDNGSVDLQVKCNNDTYYIEVKTTVTKKFHKKIGSSSQQGLWDEGYIDYIMQISINLEKFKKGILSFEHKLIRNLKSKKPPFHQL